MLHLDFETRSKVDLLTQGAHIYAQDPSTEILMMSWAFDNDPVKLWLPHSSAQYMKKELPPGTSYGAHPPDEIGGYIAAGGMIKAFNAQFERLIMWYILCPDHGVPEPKLEQFYCSMAQSRANNMPGSLMNCARAIDGVHQKGYRGNELIKLFCVPQADGYFNGPITHPIEWGEFCKYCVDDTEAERDIGRYLRGLTDSELEDYWVNERINDAGLMVDYDLAVAAEQYANEEQLILVEQIQQLTDNSVQKARGKFITEWVYAHLPDDSKELMHVYKKGELRLTFDKQSRQRLMDETEIEPDVMDVIECSDFAQASSTGKFKAMRLRADPGDDRVRGSFILNGASATGRYSARGLQPHNMPRKGYPREIADSLRYHMTTMGHNPQAVTIRSGDNIMQTLKGMLRYSIRAADGKTFVCGDYSQIEGRVNPWLAMGLGPSVDAHCAAKLAIYADPERDVYCETASTILGRIIGVDDPERQGYGKVPELSLGFGGGVGAFAGMARNYGVNLERGVMEMIVKTWRLNNLWAQPFWYALFDAAVNAVNDPGTKYDAGRISYLFQPEALGGTLWALLPSGRLLAYPQARTEWKENKFGKMAWSLTAMKAAWTPKADEKKWPRNNLWPGLLCENNTQAVAADILRELLAYLVLELGAPVVGHTHDEGLLEVHIEEADFWADLLHNAMVVGPQWSRGLPLAASIWIDDRYKK